MRAIYALGCWLLIAILVTPTEGSLFSWGKSDSKTSNTPDIDVGLVSTKKTTATTQTGPLQNTPKAQDGTKSPVKQTQSNSNTIKQEKEDSKTKVLVVESTQTQTSQTPKQSGTTLVKPQLKTERTVVVSPVKPNIQNAPISVKTEKSLESEKPVVVKEKEDPIAQAITETGAAIQTETKKQIEKNNNKIKTIEKKSDDLNKKSDDLNKKLVTQNKDDSLEDVIKDLLAVSRSRFKMQFALLIYGIVNLILFVAHNAGSSIEPSVGKAIYYMDLLSKNVVRKPLDDWFADFQKRNNDAVVRYIQKHPEEFKHIRKGKRVTITTPRGKYSFKVLTVRPGEQLSSSDLHVVDSSPLQVFRTMYELKR